MSSVAANQIRFAFSIDSDWLFNWLIEINSIDWLFNWLIEIISNLKEPICQNLNTNYIFVKPITKFVKPIKKIHEAD